jgi:pentose-5-phosphate-3-epimerase
MYNEKKCHQMRISGQKFYSVSSLKSYTKQDILEGRVIKINPALVTIIDGFVGKTSPSQLQERILKTVARLVQDKVQTFHVDINFEDYGGFGDMRPETNTAVFTPSFLGSLNDLVRANNRFLNLHLLTSRPKERLSQYKDIEFGAVCFQLDSIQNPRYLNELIDMILGMGACASPVIETVCSENLQPRLKESVLEFVQPFFDKIGMLTFQMEKTASRSSGILGMLDRNEAKDYIRFIKKDFGGTIQMQGGITTSTISKAIRLGAEFLVCGTQIFRNKEGQAPERVIQEMLLEATKTLLDKRNVSLHG